MLIAPKSWRLWMPLDTGCFAASVDIFAMSPDEFKGYLFLIISQWESEDGYLPLNEKFLQKQSKLTSAQWEGARAGIMDKFEETEHGLSNPRCRKELDKTLEKYMAKINGARKLTRLDGGLHR